MGIILIMTENGKLKKKIEERDQTSGARAAHVTTFMEASLSFSFGPYHLEAQK